MLHWELLTCVLVRNRSESGIIILYSTPDQGYLVLALHKHALLLYYLSVIYIIISVTSGFLNEYFSLSKTTIISLMTLTQLNDKVS